MCWGEAEVGSGRRGFFFRSRPRETSVVAALACICKEARLTRRRQCARSLSGDDGVAAAVIDDGRGAVVEGAFALVVGESMDMGSREGIRHSSFASYRSQSVWADGAAVMQQADVPKQGDAASEARQRAVN